jgi:hypothetical protein
MKNDALALHLQSICNALASKQSDLSPMNAKSEAIVDGVLTEYHYNGKEKTLAVYENKQHVRTLTGDEAVKTWHEIIE